MNPVNSMYGNDRVFAMWVGTRSVPPIWGFLQHAWMAGLPFWAGESHSRWWPIIVYSEANRVAASEWLAERGLDIPVLAVGAPFLYVIQMIQGLTAPESRVGSGPDGADRGAAIVYPQHDDGSDRTVPQNEGYADHLTATIGTGHTVCLHWNDFQNPAIRDAYARPGYRVICHGSNVDAHFLFSQYAALARHSRLVTNRVSTATWHGAAMGLDVSVGGPFWGPEKGDALEEAEERQRQRWPYLFDADGASVDLTAAARRELGQEWMRPPRELALALGWSGSRLQMARLLDPSVQLLRRVRRHGLSALRSADEDRGVLSRRELPAGDR